MNLKWSILVSYLLFLKPFSTRSYQSVEHVCWLVRYFRVNPYIHQKS